MTHRSVSLGNDAQDVFEKGYGCFEIIDHYKTIQDFQSFEMIKNSDPLPSKGNRNLKEFFCISRFSPDLNNYFVR